MSRLRPLIFKTRGLYPFLSIVVILILKLMASSRIMSEISLVSLALSFPVLAFRVWAAGFIGNTAQAVETHADVLITAGPYAHLRNPMYLTAMLLGLLFVAMSGLWYSVLVWIVGYAFIYYQVILYEEELLQEKFGQEYAAYCRKVPRLVLALNGYDKRVGRFRMWGATLRNVVAEFITLSIFWLLYWWL